CNDWLKFGRLFDHADALGADVVASGHHARVEQGPDGPRLLRGVDARKDQSYVLFGLPKRVLARLALPIGELSKARVRDIARQRGLPVHDKPDSQEICFVPDGDHVRFVESRMPELRVRGAIVDPQGRVVGEHQGHHRFTLGQRRGLGVALGRPVYVVDKDARTNTVVVGQEAEARVEALEAHEVNWLAQPPAGPFRALAQLRAHSAAAPALVELDLQADSLRVRFETPQRATAPGQAVVCYDANDPARVLGGGWIHTVHPLRRRCASVQAAFDDSACASR
ncbi:MAG: tRNA 2-thiouridine(34) synthase MnmA, partial [Planctomycetota bacterium]